MPDKIKTTRVYEYPNAIVRVHIPDLTVEENERRKKQIYEAARRLLEDYYQQGKRS